MPAAFVGVVCEIDVGDLCKERAGVFCKRVEGETVNNYCEDLMKSQLKLTLTSCVLT
jgi:hypothetical protein